MEMDKELENKKQQMTQELRIKEKEVRQERESNENLAR